MKKGLNVLLLFFQQNPLGLTASRVYRRYLKNTPKNLFLINDAYDAAVALYWIENYLLKSQSKSYIT
jgi:type IV secretory pathway VirB4 component